MQATVKLCVEQYIAMLHKCNLISVTNHFTNIFTTNVFKILILSKHKNTTELKKNILQQEAHGACIAHLFSPSKLFEGFCYTKDFILRNLKIFQVFPYILLCKSLSSWGGVIHDPRDFI